MMARGMKVCLGNDGFSNNMWEDWKAAYLLQKVIHSDPRRADGSAIAQMSNRNNAELINVFFPDANTGSIAEGARADLIFVDYHPFTPLSAGNLPPKSNDQVCGNEDSRQQPANDRCTLGNSMVGRSPHLA